MKMTTALVSASQPTVDSRTFRRSRPRTSKHTPSAEDGLDAHRHHRRTPRTENKRLFNELVEHLTRRAAHQVALLSHNREGSELGLASTVRALTEVFCEPLGHIMHRKREPGKPGPRGRQALTGRATCRQMSNTD